MVQGKPVHKVPFSPIPKGRKKEADTHTDIKPHLHSKVKAFPAALWKSQKFRRFLSPESNVFGIRPPNGA